MRWEWCAIWGLGFVSNAQKYGEHLPAYAQERRDGPGATECRSVAADLAAYRSAVHAMLGPPDRPMQA